MPPEVSGKRAAAPELVIELDWYAVAVPADVRGARYASPDVAIWSTMLAAPEDVSVGAVDAPTPVICVAE